MFDRKKWQKEYNIKNKDWLWPYYKKWRWDLKIDVLTHYSKGIPKCMCKGCNVKEIKFLTLDHVNNDGYLDKKHGMGTSYYLWLRRNKYPKTVKLQVLCFNCNCAKGSFGKCPHEDMRDGR